MPHPAQQITLREYIHAITKSTERVTRLTEQIQKAPPRVAYGTGSEGAFRLLRGVAPTAAKNQRGRDR